MSAVALPRGAENIVGIVDGQVAYWILGRETTTGEAVCEMGLWGNVAHGFGCIALAWEPQGAPTTTMTWVNNWRKSQWVTCIATLANWNLQFGTSFGTSAYVRACIAPHILLRCCCSAALALLLFPATWSMISICIAASAWPLPFAMANERTKTTKSWFDPGRSRAKFVLTMPLVLVAMAVYCASAATPAYSILEALLIS